MPPPAGPDLAARYGAPSRSRRTLLVALTAVVAVVGLAWLLWAAVFQATPAVHSDLVAYDVADDGHEVTATVRVVRRSEGTDASCLLRAVSDDHAIVGELSFTVDEGARQQTVRQSVRTERRPTTVDLLGCTAPGQQQRQ